MKGEYRMAVHGSALLIPFLTEATSKTIVLEALIVVAAFYALSEALRLEGARLPLITEFTLRMSHDDERPHFVARPIYLAAGVLLSLVLFPRNAAYASITIVAVGDPVASYIGQRFGRRRIGRKTLEGFAAGLVASSVAALLWVHPATALIGSVAGMSVELIGTVDDNLTTPIGAGLAMIVAGVL